MVDAHGTQSITSALPLAVLEKRAAFWFWLIMRNGLPGWL